MLWMVGCLPAVSSSSQWAPSNTGVATNVAGLVFGRVLVSVPRIGASPTTLSFFDVGPAPAGRVAEVRFEHLTDVHAARARRAG